MYTSATSGQPRLLTPAARLLPRLLVVALFYPLPLSHGFLRSGLLISALAVAILLSSPLAVGLLGWPISAWILVSRFSLHLTPSAQQYLVLFPTLALCGYAIAADGRLLSTISWYRFVAVATSGIAVMERATGRSLFGYTALEAFVSRNGRGFRSLVGAEHPLVLALLLCTAIPLVLLAQWTTRLKVLSIALLLVGIWSADARAALAIGVCSALALTAPPNIRRRLTRRPTAALLIGGATFAYLGYMSVYGWNNIVVQSTASAGSAQYRSALYSLLPRILHDVPFGIGWDNIPSGRWLVEGVDRVKDVALTVDSEPIWLAIHFGFVGLLAFGVLWVMFSFALSREHFGIALVGLIVLANGMTLAITAWNSAGSLLSLCIGVVAASWAADRPFDAFPHAPAPPIHGWSTGHASESVRPLRSRPNLV